MSENDIIEELQDPLGKDRYYHYFVGLSVGSWGACFLLILIPVFWYFGISKEVKLNLKLMETTLTNYQECKVKQIKEKHFTMASIKKNYKKVSKLGTIITVAKSKIFVITQKKSAAPKTLWKI